MKSESEANSFNQHSKLRSLLEVALTFRIDITFENMQFELFRRISFAPMKYRQTAWYS